MVCIIYTKTLLSGKNGGGGTWLPAPYCAAPDYTSSGFPTFSCCPNLATIMDVGTGEGGHMAPLFQKFVCEVPLSSHIMPFAGETGVSWRVPQRG